MHNKNYIKNTLFSLIIFTLFLTSVFVPLTSVNAVVISDNNLLNTDVQDVELTPDINVVDTGIYINDIFYSKEEFDVLLNQAIYVENGQPGLTTFSLAGTLAGTYVIPGIGPIVITITGGLIIGGTVIAAGTWVYNTVEAYFAEKAYNEHKKNGTKTDGHTVTRKLPVTGKPFTSKDRTRDGSWNGKVLQRRYYDKDGNADLDIDYTDHGNPKAHPKVPHRHDWNGKVRSSGY